MNTRYNIARNIAGHMHIFSVSIPRQFVVRNITGNHMTSPCLYLCNLLFAHCCRSRIAMCFNKWARNNCRGGHMLHLYCQQYCTHCCPVCLYLKRFVSEPPFSRNKVDRCLYLHDLSVSLFRRCRRFPTCHGNRHISSRIQQIWSAENVSKFINTRQLSDNGMHEEGLTR